MTSGASRSLSWMEKSMPLRDGFTFQLNPLAPMSGYQMHYGLMVRLPLQLKKFLQENVTNKKP